MYFVSGVFSFMIGKSMLDPVIQPPNIVNFLCHYNITFTISRPLICGGRFCIHTLRQPLTRLGVCSWQQPSLAQANLPLLTSECHTSHCHMWQCHSVTVSQWHRVTMSQCHMSQCHSVTLWYVTVTCHSVTSYSVTWSQSHLLTCPLASLHPAHCLYSNKELQYSTVYNS